MANWRVDPGTSDETRTVVGADCGAALDYGGADVLHANKRQIPTLGVGVIFAPAIF